MTMTGKKRIHFLDISKTIGIFIVVLGHYGYYLEIPFKNSILWNMEHFITLFHMPLFFIISGVLHNNSNSLKKLWVTLVRPYILLNIICIIIGLILFNDFNFSIFIRNLGGIITGADFNGSFLLYSGPLWFVYSLALIKVLFGSIGSKIYINIIIGIFAMIVMYKGNILPFRLDSSLVGYVFFYIGYYCKNIIKLISNIKKIHAFVLLIFSFFLLRVVAIYNLDFNNCQCLSINAGYYGLYPILFLFSGILGTVCIFLLSRLLDFLYNDFTRFISDVCIIILSFHQIIYFIYREVINHILGNIFIDYGYNIFYALITAVIVFSTCCLIALVCKIYCPIVLGYRK